MPEPIDVEDLALEVGKANFRDERLNVRLRALVSAVATDPQRSLPGALDEAGLEAAYRFFSNVRVTPDAILTSHIEETRKRCQAEGDFLVLHDTTMFSYRHDGHRQGLGHARPSSKNPKQSFFAHFSLAVTAERTRRPLGVAAVKTWARGPTKTGTEYQRWEEQLRASSARLNGQRHAIHVMDREADDYQMFHALIRDGHRFVARALHDRHLASVEEKLRAHLSRVSATIECDAPLTRRGKKPNPIDAKIHPPRSARIAKLSVSAATVSLKRPARRAHFTNPPESLEINVVRVWEAAPPDGEAPVEWFLYTTEPIETPEEQLTVVEHYRARWTIEEYFKAIKTGCAFEKRQLQDYESIINLLATFAPIAYRMLLIRSEARRIPEAGAELVLSKDNIDVLCAHPRAKLCANPTTRDAYLAVAALGGHLKRNGDPGWQTLARGFERLETLTEGWVLARSEPASGHLPGLLLPSPSFRSVRD